MGNDFKMPDDFSENSKKIWKSIVPSKCTGIPKKTLLIAALRALERAEQARVVICEEGMLISSEGKGLKHVHPLLKVEKDSLTLFSKIWGQLNLQIEIAKW